MFRLQMLLFFCLRSKTMEHRRPLSGCTLVINPLVMQKKSPVPNCTTSIYRLQLLLLEVVLLLRLFILHLICGYWSSNCCWLVLHNIESGLVARSLQKFLLFFSAYLPSRLLTCPLIVMIYIKKQKISCRKR